MFLVSFLCHVAIFLVIAKFSFLPAFHPQEQQVTYVDLMTLPVASPRSGTPAPAAESASEAPAAPAAPAPPPPPAAPRRPEMALPSKAKTKPGTAKSKQEKPAETKTEQPRQDEAREFNERMAKLERQAEEKRLAGTLENLKKRSGGRTGMPGFKGTQAGSDYGAYLGSRIQDAMNKQGAQHRTPSPKVMVTITIDTDGKISDYHVDRPSGDPIFDEAVERAVYLAGKVMKPPPTGRPFKQGFSFTPKEVVMR